NRRSAPRPASPRSARRGRSRAPPGCARPRSKSPQDRVRRRSPSWAAVASGHKRPSAAPSAVDAKLPFDGLELLLDVARRSASVGAPLPRLEAPKPRLHLVGREAPGTRRAQRLLDLSLSLHRQLDALDLRLETAQLREGAPLRRRAEVLRAATLTRLLHLRRERALAGFDLLDPPLHALELPLHLEPVGELIGTELLRVVPLGLHPPALLQSRPRQLVIAAPHRELRALRPSGDLTIELVDLRPQLLLRRDAADDLPTRGAELLTHLGEGLLDRSTWIVQPVEQGIETPRDGSSHTPEDGHGDRMPRHQRPGLEKSELRTSPGEAVGRQEASSAVRDVDRVAQGRGAGLHQGLPEGGVRVDGRRHVLRGRHHFHGEGRLADQIAGGGPDDVDPHDPPGARVGDDLHEAVRLRDAHGAPERGEREAPRLDGEAFLLRLLLRETDRGDLRVGEDDAGHRDPVLGGALAGDHLRRHLALLRGLVSEHGRAAHVADGVDPLDVRLAQIVRHHEPALVDLHAELFEADVTGARLHADGHEHLIALQAVRLAVLDDLHEDGAVRALLIALGTGVLEDLAPVLDDVALHDLDAVGIDAGQQVRRQLDDRELGPEGLVHHAELEADHASADDHEALGDLPQAHGLPRPDDLLAVELDPTHLDRRRAGRDDDPLGGRQTPRPAVLRADLDGVPRHDAPAPLDDLGPVRLQQAAHAARQLLDDAVLPVLHLLSVDGQAVHLDAVRADGLSLRVEVRVGDQRLRGDAAPVEAHSAVLFFFDTGGLHAELRQPDGTDITAGTPAKDNRVKLVGHGGCA